MLKLSSFDCLRAPLTDCIFSFYVKFDSCGFIFWSFEVCFFARSDYNIWFDFVDSFIFTGIRRVLRFNIVTQKQNRTFDEFLICFLCVWHAWSNCTWNRKFVILVICAKKKFPVYFMQDSVPGGTLNSENQWVVGTTRRKIIPCLWSRRNKNNTSNTIKSRVC